MRYLCMSYPDLGRLSREGIEVYIAAGPSTSFLVVPLTHR